MARRLTCINSWGLCEPWLELTVAVLRYLLYLLWAVGKVSGWSARHDEQRTWRMQSGWRTIAPAKARLTLRWVLLGWTEDVWEKLFEVGSAKHHVSSPKAQLNGFCHIARAAPVERRAMLFLKRAIYAARLRSAYDTSCDAGSGASGAIRNSASLNPSTTRLMPPRWTPMSMSVRSSKASRAAIIFRRCQFCTALFHHRSRTFILPLLDAGMTTRYGI